MLKLLVEYIGTFIFLSVILQQGQALPIAIALATAIFFGGSVSGGHFNPAVSLMMFAKGVLQSQDLFMYILVQCLGGLSALYYFNLIPKSLTA